MWIFSLLLLLLFSKSLFCCLAPPCSRVNARRNAYVEVCERVLSVQRAAVYAYQMSSNDKIYWIWKGEKKSGNKIFRCCAQIYCSCWCLCTIVTHTRALSQAHTWVKHIVNRWILAVFIVFVSKFLFHTRWLLLLSPSSSALRFVCALKDIQSR